MSTVDPASFPDVPGYAVRRVVGHGATSTVWAAVERESGAEVALKMPDPTAHRREEVLSQATREIAVLERVASEHVVRLHRTLTLPDGGVALVLDLADGGSLGELVAARGRLTEGEVATIFTALCTTLDVVHKAGVVHGDLAAGNVLFTIDGKPMLADFAAARLVGESDPPVVEGTPGFVAPEVARGDIPTEASDAYGIGALAWFALTGAPRRDAETSAPDLAEAIGFLGKRVGPVVAPLLAIDADERPDLLTAAAGFYGAATPVPVTLLGGAVDPALALTRRIRAQAAAGSSAGRDDGMPRLDMAVGGWLARLGAPLRRAAGRVGRAARRLVAVTHSRWPVLAVLALALAALFGVGRSVGFWVEQSRIEAAAASTAAEVDGSPSSHVAGQQPTGTVPSSSAQADTPTSSDTTLPPLTTPARMTQASSSPANSTEAVRSRPVEVLTSLAEARAAALVSGDPKALDRVHAAGSPMHRFDTDLLADLAAQQRAYAGLSFAVRSAEWIGGEGSKALVRAVVDRSAYRLLGPAAQYEEFSAQAGTVYTYELALDNGQWRLVTIT